MMKKICVTGGSGDVGNAAIEELQAAGYSCVNLDIAAPRIEICPSFSVDMTDYGAVFEVFQDQKFDALVHCAGNRLPDHDHYTAALRFENNTIALFNAFNAAQATGIKRVVWASSETVLGFPFETNRQKELPLDETSDVQPQGGYALSKLVSENLAEHMAKLYDMTFVGLRFSNVIFDDPNIEANYDKFPSYWEDLDHRKFNLWGYIDSRDAARSIRLGLEVDLTGAEVFSIVAPNTLMAQDTRVLVETIMPESKLDPELTGRQSLVSCDKAQRVLGFSPQYFWEDILDFNSSSASEDKV